jgi:hypothetical protein
MAPIASSVPGTPSFQAEKNVERRGQAEAISKATGTPRVAARHDDAGNAVPCVASPGAPRRAPIPEPHRGFPHETPDATDLRRCDGLFVRFRSVAALPKRTSVQIFPAITITRRKYSHSNACYQQRRKHLSCAGFHQKLICGKDLRSGNTRRQAQSGEDTVDRDPCHRFEG